MTWGNQLAVTEDCHDDSSKWNLLELPASVGGSSAIEKKHFMLGNVKYPSYVAETGIVQECEQCFDGTDGHGERQYRDCNCRNRYVPTASQVYKMEQAHVLNLRPAEWEETAFMIQSSTNMGRSWDVKQYSWSLSTSHSYDPGPQGYWKFDPPLDIPGSGGGNGGKFSAPRRRRARKQCEFREDCPSSFRCVRPSDDLGHCEPCNGHNDCNDGY